MDPAAFVLFAISLGLLWWTGRRSLEKQENEDWQEQVCNVTRKCSREWKVNPVLLISLDGFRHNYLKRNTSPSIQKLADCGSHAEMLSSFPTVTFPNHYSIVTGLYPESHGIVGNSMIDSKIGKFSLRNKTAKEDPRWWGGEPMWNTVHKSGLKSSTYFWPGSDGVIGGDRPDTWLPYNNWTPFEDRVDKVIEWLLVDDDERSSFLTLYMNEPDHQSHEYGPDSDETNAAITRVDQMIARLYESLAIHDLINCVNVIIVSDHGSATMKHPSTYDSLNLNDIGMPMDGLRVFAGPVGRVQVVNEKSELTNHEIADYISNATNKMNDTYRVYKLDEIPRRLHFRMIPNRIGSVVISADIGKAIYPNYPENMKGSHGYDYKHKDMRALFVAHGPGINSGAVQQPFQNVEIYNFIAELLGLEKNKIAPNNGTEGALWKLIRGVRPPATKKLQTVVKNDFLMNREQNICAHNAKQQEICKNYFRNSTATGKRRLSESDAKSWKPLVGLTNGEQNPNLWQSSGDKFIFQYQRLPTLRHPRGLLFVQTLIEDLSDLNNSANRYKCSLTTKRVSVSCATIQRHSQSVGLNMTFISLSPVDSNTALVKVWTHNDFALNVMTEFKKILQSQVSTFGKVIVISGPIYDDDENSNKITDIFYVTLMCTDRRWFSCKNESSINVNSYILPIAPKRRNTGQSLRDYIFDHTARVREIEELTGLRFFDTLPPSIAIHLRTHVNLQIYGTDNADMINRYLWQTHKLMND